MADNLLSLSSKDAKTFFIKTDSYFSGELPKYFHFTKMLYNIGKLYEKYKKYIHINNSKHFEDVNFVMYTNKDGNYDWRKFQLINPILYIDFIYCITDDKNWKIIVDRFNKLHNLCKKSIICTSIPVVGKNTYRRSSGKQILEWWEKTELGAVALAQEFPIVVTTDIADCYPSIYTHSLSWALHGIGIAKKNKNDNRLLGNIINKKIQNMQDGQTNGIPQGSIIMDFLAELVLAYADCILYNCLRKNKKLKSSFKILRYRDDYKIFVHSKFDGEQIIKELSKILLKLNLKLNSSKTDFYDNVIYGSIKKDKIYAINHDNIYKEEDIYKTLLRIVNFQQLFQNSRQMVKYLLKINKNIRSAILQKNNKLIDNEYIINAIIGICIIIALKNPAISINCLQIVSTIIEHLSEESARSIINNMIHRFESVPHSEFVTLFIQRIILPYNYEELFHGKIYKCVYDTQNGSRNIQISIWNNDWLENAPRGFKEKIKKEKFIHEKIIKNMKKAMSNDEIDIFSKYYPNI